MLNHAVVLSKLLTERPGLVFNVGGHFDKVQRFYDALEKAGYVNTEMCWASCARGQEQNLVFIGNETDVYEKLVAMQPVLKNTVPTPTSVLVKMLALRLRKLHDEILRSNEHIVRTNTYHAQNTTQNPAYKYTIGIEIAPITIDDVHNRFASLLTSNTFYGRREILDILKFLDRPDITEEIILRAYDRHSVMEVMTE
jgi:hypothetical protein